MLTRYTSLYTKDMRETMYQKLNQYAEKSPKSAMLMAIPVSIADVLSEPVRLLAQAIEHLAFGTLNLFGSLYHRDCAIKDGIKGFEGSIVCLTMIPGPLVMAPFKLFYQIIVNVWNPKDAQRFDRFNYNRINRFYFVPIK